jgi:hypothetical protein
MFGCNKAPSIVFPERPTMSEAPMLHEIEILEARRIADLAAAARDARSRILTPVPEAELGEPQPARGEHHPVGALAFAEVTTYRALRKAVDGLPADIRRKLRAVMRVGSGDYARAIGMKRWRQRGICLTRPSLMTSLKSPTSTTG